MRRIGIRISDLRELCFDCIFQDERGLNYIKIPPGKLKRERLFPLDDDTLRLIKNIQRKSFDNAGGKTPEKLIIHTSGRPPQEKEYYEVLYEISEHIRLDRGLSVGPESLVSHRLRHTFATTLINAGISIEALKDLLGHRDIKMTLKYARVMPETIRKDYLSALDKIKNEIKAPELAITNEHMKSDDMLVDILRRLRARIRAHPQQHTTIKSLIRRVERLKADLNDFV
jgi:integrase